MRQPFRMEICKILLGRGPLSQRDLAEALRPAYGRETQFLALDDHLQSLRAVGSVHVESEWVESLVGKETLAQRWGVTGRGRACPLKKL